MLQRQLKSTLNSGTIDWYWHRFFCAPQTSRIITESINRLIHVCTLSMNQFFSILVHVHVYILIILTMCQFANQHYVHGRNIHLSEN